MSDNTDNSIWWRVAEPILLGFGFALTVGAFLAVLTVIGGMFILLIADRLGLLGPMISYELSEPGGVFIYLWAMIKLGFKVFLGSIAVLTPLVGALSLFPPIGRALRDESHSPHSTVPASNASDDENKPSTILTYVDHMSGHAKRQRERSSIESDGGGIDFDWLG